MEAAAWPSSQRRRASGSSGGGGGACIGDLPDALLSRIFESIEWSHRASVALVSPRWHRVLYETPSLWRSFELSAPAALFETGGSWSVEEQEGWLAAKLSQLRRVCPAVESLAVERTAGADVLADVLLSVRSSRRLTRIAAGGYEEPLSATAVRALGSLTQLQDVAIGNTYDALPPNFHWAVGRLTALRSLALQSFCFPASLQAMLAYLPHLTSLVLRSTDPLPDLRPLTALAQLRELELSEVVTHDGLEVLPASAFPERTFASFQSEALKVGDFLQLAAYGANGNHASCVFSRDAASRLEASCITLTNMWLTHNGAVHSLAWALKPAGCEVAQLQLKGCVLSADAWHPAPGEWGTVTTMKVEECVGPWVDSGPAIALDAALQQMSSLRSLHIAKCNLSSGLPAVLCQLSGLTHLSLCGAQLAYLPPLACMSGLQCLNLNSNTFAQLPWLGWAPRLRLFYIEHNPNLLLDGASVERLAGDAPNLRYFSIGGPAAAGARLARMLHGVTVA